MIMNLQIYSAGIINTMQQLQKRMTCACAVFNALLCFAEFCTTYIHTTQLLYDSLQFLAFLDTAACARSGATPRFQIQLLLPRTAQCAVLFSANSAFCKRAKRKSRACACGAARACDLVRARACVRALVSLHGVSSRKNSSFKDRGQCTRIVHTLAHSGVTWPGEVLHAVLAEVDSLSAIFCPPPYPLCTSWALLPSFSMCKMITLPTAPPRT